jgi:hypothetical protein
MAHEGESAHSVDRERSRERALCMVRHKQLLLARGTDEVIIILSNPEPPSATAVT